MQVRCGYGGLNQKDNATEGRKPGIDERGIGEENRFCSQFVEWDEGNDKHRECEDLGIGCLPFRLNEGLVGPVVFTNHGNVYARTFPAF